MCDPFLANGRSSRDFLNNVERVELPISTLNGTQLTVEVRAVQLPVESQSFALVASGMIVQSSCADYYRYQSNEWSNVTELAQMNDGNDDVTTNSFTQWITGDEKESWSTSRWIGIMALVVMGSGGTFLVARKLQHLRSSGRNLPVTSSSP